MVSVLGVLAAEALLALVFVVAGAQMRFRPPRGHSFDVENGGSARADAVRTRRILRVVVPAGLAVFLLLPLLDLAEGRRLWMVSAMLGATTMVWGAALGEMVRPSRLHGTGPASAVVAPRFLRPLVVASVIVLAVLLLLGWASGSTGGGVGKAEADGLVYFHAGSLAFLEPWPGEYFAKPAVTALLCLVLVAAFAAEGRRRHRGTGGDAGAVTSAAATTLVLAFLGLGLVLPLVQTGLMILGHAVVLPGFLLEMQVLAGIGILLAAGTAVVALLGIRRALSRGPVSADAAASNDDSAREPARRTLREAAHDPAPWDGTERTR